MDGRVGEWVGGVFWDRWMDGLVVGQTYVSMNFWMDGLMDGRVG